MKKYILAFKLDVEDPKRVLDHAQKLHQETDHGEGPQTVEEALALICNIRVSALSMGLNVVGKIVERGE